MDVFVFQTPEGLAAVHVGDIGGIFPDLNNSERSIIYTTMFPQGLTVEKPSEQLVGQWLVMYDEEEEGEEDDDDTA